VTVQVYRNLTKGCWSLRSGGRVIAHHHRVTLRACTMRVCGSGRQRVLLEGQRNVHAWVEGNLVREMIDGGPVEIGYNPFLAPTFTVRPGFVPVFEAQAVTFSHDGRAYAVL
jgi:hypothetical protein